METSGRGLLMAMIQPINQRRSVIDVGHKLEQSALNLYSILQFIKYFANIISFAFTTVA